MTVEFMVIGEPKSKKRPQFTNTPKGVLSFTPKDTVMYENLVALSYRQMCGDVKLQGQLEAEITAYFDVPKSVSKKKREEMLAGKIRHTKKPDTDNIAKVILDSLNKIAFDDDKQVCRLTVNKCYGVNAGVVVRLTELEDGTDGC